MKFLLYSEAGEAAQILKKIELEGNEVGLYVNDPAYKNVWNNLLPYVEPEKFVDKETIIIFDASGNGKIADKWKKAGHFVYGASKFADRMERDRAFGFEVMDKYCIKVPETKEFRDFEEGLDYVRASNKRLVFKPSGDMPCKLTYVSKDKADLLTYMKYVDSKFGSSIKSFVLQEFVVGTVVSTEFFCNGKKFLWPPNHTVEVKKSMNDDLGPSTGCSGNVTWITENDALVDSCYQVEDMCVAEGYCGQMDLNAVLTESGEVYGLEWTPRIGYDATPTFVQLFNTDFGKVFSDIARGQLKELPVIDGYAAGVRVTIPPYPADEANDSNIGVPIQNYDEESCYFYEVMEDDGQLVHSCGTGVICCCLGYGQTPQASVKRAYEHAKKINVPDKQYRTDLDKVLPKMIKEIYA